MWNLENRNLRYHPGSRHALRMPTYLLQSCQKVMYRKSIDLPHF